MLTCEIWRIIKDVSNIIDIYSNLHMQNIKSHQTLGFDYSTCNAKVNKIIKMGFHCYQW